MQQNSVKYYPVGNGDQSLITLKDKTTILTDCNIRQGSKDGSDPAMFDVKKDLLQSIQTDGGVPFVDVFILTHGDKDHCRGFRDNFYRGDPTKYADKDRKAGLIRMDEMWFSPMVAVENTNEEETAHQEEAERRIDLHLKNDPQKDLPGNRIRIIGYDPENRDYSALAHLRYVPGSVVTLFNNKQQETFSVFIHSPFKEQLASADPDDKNTASIVFQARFKEYSFSTEFSNLFMFGGDADYIAWDVILQRTVRYENDVKQKALDWDIFLAPHHCSWTFFNESSNKDEVQDSSIEVLRYRRTGGKVIASSKVIIDNDDNPPCYKAKKEYLKHLDSGKDFLNTDTYPKESEPVPIVFVTTANGPVLSPTTVVKTASGAAGGAGAASTIIKQG
ncbi:hypothetical protein [Lacibacter sp.]|uniref:hypothetical protein n=1 Tax=Lacibacter sp. TaxID=1915409 RepID=UPI002B4B8E47|nr:hypothetical protein [Lacibacter sp.]HLP37745.1 hypothetical protein [Lacibacter sp.]